MKQAGLIIGVVVLIIGVSVASVELAGRFLGGNEAKAATVQCSKIKTHYQVVFQNNQIMPDVTNAHLCDSLTIINKDNKLREIAFGPHDHHVAYDGVLERLLNQEQSLTVTLNQAGNFSFHDHIDDSLVGYFNVSGS